MRVLVDIPDRMLEDLGTLCNARKLSRAEAVRRALDVFLSDGKPRRSEAFGLWKGQAIVSAIDEELMPEDGLAYQERMRSEW